MDLVSNVVNDRVLYGLRTSKTKIGDQSLSQVSLATRWYLKQTLRYYEDNHPQTVAGGSLLTLLPQPFFIRLYKLLYSKSIFSPSVEGKELLKIESQFLAWEKSASNQSDFVPCTTFYDLRMCINGVCELNDILRKKNIYLSTKFISQNRLEGLFGEVRGDFHGN